MRRCPSLDFRLDGFRLHHLILHGNGDGGADGEDFADAPDLGSDLDLCIGASSGSEADRFRLVGNRGVGCGVSRWNIAAKEHNIPLDDDEAPPPPSSPAK